MKLKKGDRIRLKVRTVFGFKGTATVMEDQVGDEPDATIRFKKDGSTEEHCYACRHEVAKIRKPTP